MEPIYFHRAFTLVEMMVVLAIIGAVTALTLNSQSSFNKTLILANTAYDIALTIRSAETFGIGSRASGSVSTVGYGVHFQTATPGVLTLFADTNPSPNASNCHGLPAGGADAPDAKPGDCIYSAGQDQKMNEYTLGNNITISALYAGGVSVNSLDIVFSRPNPDAFIRANGSSYSSACLTITSPQGGSRYVSVASSGVIIANATSCP